MKRCHGWFGVLFLGLVFALPASADEDWLEPDFGEAKPVKLQLEADICHSYLRMRVNRSMQKEYEKKTGDEAWIEMIETFQQEAKEAAKGLDRDQEKYKTNFGRKFDVDICGTDDAVAHTSFEQLQVPPPEDAKALEAYVAVVPEPNLLLAACAIRASAEDDTKARALAQSLEAQKPGAKRAPAKAEKKKKKKGKAEPEPTSAPTPPPAGSAKLRQLEDAYQKRYGKKPDYARCEG